MKEAVVLLNMGGPNNIYEVELFLRNMFNDPLILTIKNNFVRKTLASFIVNSRAESAKNIYSKIGSKSPLTELTFELTKKLQDLDKSRFYTYAMRYTPPFASSVAQELKDKNIEKITLFSMYPQYSTTTILSSLRDFLRALKEINFNPEIKIIESYPTHRGFIDSCIEQIESKIKENNIDEKEFILLLSAHAIPQRTSDSGDPYKDEINLSAQEIKKSLESKNIFFKEVCVSFQSKIGPIKWLEPSTIDSIKSHKNDKIMIYPIAFTIDNSETIFELEIEDRRIAREFGVSEYIVCKCPNSSEIFARAVIDIINNEGKLINEARI